MMVNPYQILGVPDRSSLDVVKTAYRKLILKLHPDQAKENYDKKKFLIVQACWEFLSDPAKKDQLDNLIDNKPPIIIRRKAYNRVVVVKTGQYAGTSFDGTAYTWTTTSFYGNGKGFF